MICFAWSGFPQYAARCVGAFVRSTDEKVVVVATRPHVPIQGMEKYCGCDVVWIDADEMCDVRQLLGEMPRVLFENGWSTPAFNRLRDQVRAAGGKVFVSVDNNFVFSLKELVKAVRFRLFLRWRYNGYFVPGRSGVRLLRFYGVPAERIQMGMYAADASLFSSGKSILERPKRIVFIGQLCDRKNILMLARAFLSIDEKMRAGWTLEVCGCGPQRDEIPQNAAIVVHDFVQPEALAEIYANARIFVLPSKEEHWGLVVHEAALSGCVLLVSERVGAAEDFVTVENGVLFDPFSENSLRGALTRALCADDKWMERAERVTRRLSANASLERFVGGVKNLMG